jgi:hypothetical protein
MVDIYLTHIPPVILETSVPRQAAASLLCAIGVFVG